MRTHTCNQKSMQTAQKRDAPRANTSAPATRLAHPLPDFFLELRSMQSQILHREEHKLETLRAHACRQVMWCEVLVSRVLKGNLYGVAHSWGLCTLGMTNDWTKRVQCPGKSQVHRQDTKLPLLSTQGPIQVQILVVAATELKENPIPSSSANKVKCTSWWKRQEALSQTEKLSRQECTVCTVLTISARHCIGVT